MRKPLPCPSKRRRIKVSAPVEAAPLRLDLGCGKNKAPGFTGVDSQAFEGVDIVLDLLKFPWPWEDDSVSEVHSSHFLEHIPGRLRIQFFNELYRILKFDGRATIATPDWSNACAYGDPTHEWPPISGWYPLYLNKAWRDTQAPHVPYTCDFEWTVAASWEQWLMVRPQETKEFAMQRYVNSTRDLIVTLTKVDRTPKT